MLRYMMLVLTVLFALPAGLLRCDCDHCENCELLSDLSWVLLVVGLVFVVLSTLLEQNEYHINQRIIADLQQTVAVLRAERRLLSELERIAIDRM